jgi:hypothetical protein
MNRLLAQAGWVVQDREAMNLGVGPGVAVREFRLRAGPCDYLLFLDRKEAFGFVVTDGCHRSIHGRWRQVLDYVDASTSARPHNLSGCLYRS